MPNPRTFYKHRTQSSKLFAPPLEHSVRLAFEAPYLALSGSIRARNALSRPFGLNTGFWAPYFANAQYGLLGALFR